MRVDIGNCNQTGTSNHPNEFTPHSRWSNRLSELSHSTTTTTTTTTTTGIATEPTKAKDVVDLLE